jgi:hypothetical protein
MQKPLVSNKDFINISKDVAGFEFRISYFKDVLSDEKISCYVSDFSPKDIWLEIVKELFSEKEWNESICTNVIAKWREHKRLPAERFSKRENIYRIVDALLLKNNAYISPVCEWLSIALDFLIPSQRFNSTRPKELRVSSDNIFSQRRYEKNNFEEMLFDVVNLLSWSTKENLLAKKTINQEIYCRNEHLSLCKKCFGRCLDIAKAEKDCDLKTIIEKDVIEAGIEIETPVSSDAEDKIQDPFIESMKAGVRELFKW